MTKINHPTKTCKKILEAVAGIHDKHEVRTLSGTFKRMQFRYLASDEYAGLSFQERSNKLEEIDSISELLRLTEYRWGAEP